VHRADNKLPLFIQAVPIRPGTGERFENLALGPGGVLLILHDPAGKRGGSVENALAHLGLTRGQARVAALIGQGQSPRAAAETLGLTEGTVRAVLKSVFAKLNISRQSELAILITRLP
jgi:DNA-binding CsgD family transcriptional regulator